MKIFNEKSSQESDSIVSQLTMCVFPPTPVLTKKNTQSQLTGQGDKIEYPMGFDFDKKRNCPH